MKLRKRRRPASVSMDMTPMIDVTFQLIIFFMTVSQSSMVENAQLQLPQMKGQVDQEEMDLTVNITKDGNLILKGKEVEPKELDTRILQVLQQVNNKPDLIKVVLRVDRQSTSIIVNQVVRKLERAGIRRIRVAVEVPNPRAGG